MSLGKYANRFGLDIVGIQDLNLGKETEGRRRQALTGLQQEGYVGFFHSPAGRTKRQQGVGILVHQRHMANADVVRLRKDKAGRALTLDVKMLGGDTWRFTSVYHLRSVSPVQLDAQTYPP